MSEDQPQLGAIVHDDGVTFRLWAPFADAVCVMGDFNAWSQTATPMSHEDGGVWAVTVPGAHVGQEYKFIIHNGNQVFERNDPRALQITAANDASVIVDPEFNWEGDAFELPPLNRQIVYELHIGTFNRPDPATPGTLHTAIEKLDHLASLGVNVVELMPVNSTTVDRWWGYDPDFIYAVDAAYGGRKAFLDFVKAAHYRGIGVVVDVVYNHMSPYDGMDLWRFDGWSENGMGGIYFYNDWRGVTPWGDTRFDYGRPEVRRYLTDNVRMWLQDCHVDGLRVDSTIYMRNVKGQNDDPANDVPEAWGLLQALNRAARDAKPGALMIAEDTAVNSYITKPAAEGGAGFAAQWETSFPYPLRGVISGNDDGNRDLLPLADAITKAYNGDPFQRIIYGESHDVVADANGHTRVDEEVSPGDAGNIFARRRSTLAAAIILTSPGIPMLFQGQEFMEDGSFNHWDPLDWGKVEEYGGILELYKHLMALRLDRYGNTRGLTGSNCRIIQCDTDNKLLAYHRSDQGGAGDDIVVVLNFTNATRTGYGLPFPADGTWQVRFNSDWEGYSPDFTNTPTPDVVVSEGNGSINIGPYSALILSQEPA